MTPRLEFQAVSKVFAGRTALDRLTLSLEPGEILGFLGPNGAGKTTAIHLALGLIRPTSGGGSLLGRSFGDPQARARVGFVPDQPVFFAERAQSSVEFAARLNGVHDPQLKGRIRDLLATVGLKPSNAKENERDVRKFSRGMQQRLALAQALVNDPELLILDEPASALDPAGVLEVRELLLAARHAGKSIFFSSHQLTEVEHICDRIAFLREGCLVRQGSLDLLLGESQGEGDRMEAQVRGLSQTEAKRLFPEAPFDPASSCVRLTFPGNQQRSVLETVWNAGGEIVNLLPHKRSLEDLFLDWTGQGHGVQSRSEEGEGR